VSIGLKTSLLLLCIYRQYLNAFS